MRPPQWRLGDLRVVVLGLLLLLAWGGVGYRVYVVQGVEAAELARRGVDQRLREETIPARRGTIFAADGTELALTVLGKSVVADPSLIVDPVGAAAAVAPFLDTEPGELEELLSGDGRYAMVARFVEPSVAESLATALQAEGIHGFTMRPASARRYPAGPLAAAVIGLTRLDDGSGIEGLELSLDDVLTGQPGKRIVERDPYGRAIPQGVLILEPAIPGGDAVLTIDRRIQSIAEEFLAEGVARTGARWGAAVVLDPVTGEILAMASVPGFDPNDRSTVDPERVRNRAVTETYEPGSTLKVVTIAAALEEGLVAPSTTFEVPQRLEVGEFQFEDPSRHPSVMSVSDIITRSSNVGTIEVQQLLGDEAHYRYLDAFGLGRTASIDFPGERAGRLSDVSDWCEACGESAAIGYGVAVTPLQLAAIFATIANDGEWVEPHVVAAVVDGEGNRDDTEPRRRRVISPSTARTMRQLLARVVAEGTGRRAAVPGWKVGGKTGTTLKYDPETKSYTENTFATFVGMAPLDAPRIVVAVTLDTPTGETDDGTDQRYGGASAAPIFARIAEQALRELDVPADG